MVSMPALSVEDHGFNPQPGQTQDIKMGICFSTKHAEFRSKSKDELAQNVSE